jgi:mannitol-specific phosphotransferase system IIBC component
LSKTTKSKQQLNQLPANLNFLTAMTQANSKFVMGRSMLTVDAIHKVGKPCVELHNYYINNYKSDQDIIVSYKDLHFLVGDDIFLIS